MPETAGPFNPVEILRALADHHVEFILIGGLAATVHGSPFATFDVDVVPRRATPNLERLSAALHSLEARVYVSPNESIRFNHDGVSLAGADMWNLSTSFGGLDISFVPSGTDGYTDLAERADRVNLGGIDVDVAALEDVIRSKATAARDRDNVVLPALRRLLEIKRERQG